MTLDRRPGDTDDLFDEHDVDEATVVRPGGGRDLAPVTWRDDEAEQLQAELDDAARTRRVPHVMTAVTAGAGVGAWGCAQVAAALGGPTAWSVVAAIVLLGTVVTVPVARAILRERIEDRWVRRWWFSTACAAAWVDVVAVQGAALIEPDTAIAVLAVLVLGSALLGARWRDEHEVPQPGDEPEEPPVATPAIEPADVPAAADVVFTAEQLEAEAIELAWDTEVAAGEHPIAARAQLHGRTALPHGWRWEVRLDRGGSVGCSDLTDEGSGARVAFKLAKQANHVWLEPIEDDPREDRAMLTVVTRDVLAGGVDYGGPRYDRGAIPIGLYADGSGEAIWRALDGTGVLCGLITGGQGSGKSALAAGVGMSLRRSGEWIVLAGDGDEQGGSSHLLGEVAHDFARGPAEVLEQLEGLEAWGRIRGDLMHTLTIGPDGRPTPITRPGQLPVAKIMPCPAYPGFVWIIHEFYRLAKDSYLQSVNFVDRVEALVRILRKYGGSIIVETQSALGDDFDGNSALRGMLAAGNRIAMRNRNKSEDGIADDGLSPGALPKGGGYAFIGEGERTAMMRSARPEDMERWVPEVVRHGRPDERSWAAFRRHRTVRELDPAVDYAERMVKIAAFDEAIATGAPLPGSAEALAEAADVDDEAELSVGGLAVPTLTGNVVAIRPDLHEPEVAAQVPPSADDRPLPDKARRVLDDLHAHPGPRQSAEIVKATGLSGPDVSKALRVLVDRGLARRCRQGVHEVVEQVATDRRAQ